MMNSAAQNIMHPAMMQHDGRPSNNTMQVPSVSQQVPPGVDINRGVKHPTQPAEIPENITVRDLYALMLNTQTEFRTSMQNIQAEVAALTASMSNIGPRVEACETRISKLEDGMDDKFKDQEAALTSLINNQDDFPVETTLVCSGLKETAREDIYDKTQELVESGLGLVNVQVEKALRLKSRNDKPGLVKIKLPTVNDKVAALRAKRNLVDTGYKQVYLRSSQSHSDRVMQQNLQTILKELPNGDSYRVTGHGKLVKKDNPVEMGTWSRGPPVHPVSPAQDRERNGDALHGE
jgi:hypothetical protein